MCRSFAAAAALLFLMGAPAGAQTIMTLNHIVTDNMPHADCMSRARRTLQAAGLVYHDTTSEAQWGLSEDRAYMVAIYCLITRDVAVFAASGAEGSVTGSLVTRMTDAWQSVGTAPGGVPQPTPGK